MRGLPISLRGRLLAAATLLIAVALLGTAALTYVILDRFMHRQIDQQLDAQIVALRATLTSGSEGIEETGTIDSPPFDRPGWYWQIVSGGKILGSRSLAGGKLDVPASEPLPPPVPGVRPLPPVRLFLGPPPVPGDGPGPKGEALHFRSQEFRLGTRSVTITATAPQDAFARPLQDAMMAVFLSLSITAIALISAMVFQVRLGLKPLQALRQAVADILAGRAERLPGGQPSEVAPLADEINKLIAENVEGLARARRHVSNLAHGLKTPLANLSLALQRRSDDPELQALVGLLDRRIRHHLARARAAALGGPARTQTSISTKLPDVVAALAQIYAQRGLVTEVVAEPTIAVLCEPQDVDEMLGNLLDNAFKGASARVRISAYAQGASIAIAIEDDGLGLSADAIAEVLQPGQRLDERTPGYGFGLPIARELAELYGGSLTLGPSELGGLCCTLTLPKMG